MKTEVTDPIRKDASEVTAGKEAGLDAEGAPDPREEAIARIEQANIERMEEEQAAFDAQAGGEAPTPGGRREEPHGAAAATTEMVKVIVDGEERDLPLAEVVKGYQKDATATQRLREASDRLKDVEQREREIADREVQLKLQTADLDDNAVTGDDEALDAALDAWLEGDRDPIRNLLKKAVGGAEGAALSQDDIDRVVNQRLTERDTAQEHNAASEAFKKDYQEIFEDPFLLDMANKRYFAKVNEGMSITEAMADAGRETREWLAAKTGTAAPDPLREKLQRKQSLDTITPAGGRTAGGGPGDDYSPQATIAEMKKERGQA
jgi:hypothetical protein